MKTNEILRSDNIVKEDKAARKRTEILMKNIDNTTFTLGEALRSLKPTGSVIITKN